MANYGVKRVAVTGMGCVSGLGQGVEATWAAAIAGETGVRALSRTAGESFTYSGPAAFIPNLDTSAVEAKFGARALSHLDPVAVFASVASYEALEQAGLIGDPALSKAAVLYGVGSGGNATVEESYFRVIQKGASTVHPLTIPKFMASAAPSQISILFGIKGLTYTIGSACASSAHAISEGMHLIRAGRAKVVVAGGAEATLAYGPWIAWKAVRAMSPTACRPFSTGRDGMILGEGAATLVLEDWDHAVARGAKILGEVIGSGASSDAFHITQPDGEGAVTALREALEDAGIDPATPVLISAHGTGTGMNDKTEAGAIREVFGEHLANDLVIATKSQHGHLLGGAGAIEFILGILAIQRGLAPPVLNYLGPDPECEVPLALRETKAINYEVLVSNSFAFGGLNSVLVAKRV